MLHVRCVTSSSLRQANINKYYLNVVLWGSNYTDAVQHMTDEHIRKCTMAQCITCDMHFDTIDALFAHIDAVHESGNIDAKSRLLQYSGPIKAATNGQDDGSKTPPVRTSDHLMQIIK